MPTNPIGDPSTIHRLPQQSALLQAAFPEAETAAPQETQATGDRLDLSKNQSPNAEGTSFVGTVLAKTVDALKGLVISSVSWIMDALPFLREEKAAKALSSFDSLRKKYGADPEWKKLENLVSVPTVLPASTTRAKLAACDTRIDELQAKLNETLVKNTMVEMSTASLPKTGGTDADSVQVKLAAELAKREALCSTPPTDPQLKAIWDQIEVGDIMLTSSGPDSAVGVLTAGDEVTHSALCTKKGPPPVFVEAIGITGDLKDPTSNQVREVDFWTFFEGTEKKEANQKRFAFHIVRPNYGETPETQQKNLSKALGFAQDQIGKPYDYFFDGEDSKAFFCSELVRKSFEGTDIKLQPKPPSDPEKEKKQTLITQGIQDSLKYLCSKYKLSEQELFDLSTNPTKLTEMMTVEALGMANDDASYGTFIDNFNQLMNNLGPLMLSGAKEKLTGMSDFIRHIAQNGAYDRKNLSEILDFGLSRIGASIPPGALKSFILGKGSQEIRMQSGLVHSGNQQIASDDFIEGLGKENKAEARKRSTTPQDLAYLPVDGKNILSNVSIAPEGSVISNQ